MRLVLIETSGNQEYIFATNRMRENVGASELTCRVGTQWVLEAVKNVGGPDLCQHSGDSSALRQALRDAQRNTPLEEAHQGVEVILAASGKALLAVAEEAVGRQIIASVTSQALTCAPGLDVRGVVSRHFDMRAARVHDVVREVHRELEGLRGRLPSPQQRFLRLPVVDQCATSGLPASDWRTPAAEEPLEPVSIVSKSKRCAAQDGLRRMRNAVAGGFNRMDPPAPPKLPSSADELEGDMGCEWLAVVHADGNGLGQVFLQFDEYISPRFQDDGQAHNRAYLNTLREFSLALDECTEAAFCKALQGMKPPPPRSAKKPPDPNVVPILPLVLGGDDLTVLCDGLQAMEFTRRFLEAFASEAKNGTIQQVLSRKNGVLTASAGIAIIKPHFPFFVAYELSAALLQSAKRVKPQAAVDWHVVLDASGPDLERTRRRLLVDGGKTSLTARPYVLDGQAIPSTGSGHHRLSELQNWIRIIQRGSSQERIPRSVLHDVKQALFLGHKQADARLELMAPRHGLLKHLAAAGSKPVSLFYPAAGGMALAGGQVQRYTGFLDALELASFWEV